MMAPERSAAMFAASQACRAADDSDSNLLAAAVITFALAWSEFLYALILTATPRSQTFSIAVWSFVSEFEIIWNQMAAVGVISALVPVALLLLARRYVISALTFGAVREKA